jgi:hypothetical protein
MSTAAQLTATVFFVRTSFMPVARDALENAISTIFTGVAKVSSNNPERSKTDQMWAKVAADMERLVEENETLNRTCAELRLELAEARRLYDVLKKSLQGPGSG